MMYRTFAYALLAFCVLSCGNKSSQKNCIPASIEFPEELKTKELNTQMQAIKDSAELYKSLCFASEEIKSKAMKELLTKLEAHSLSDKSLLEIARSEFNNAEKSKYDQNTFTKDEVVSLYDTYTMNYVEAVSRIRARLSNFDEFDEIEGGEKLYRTLTKANDDDLRLRYDYNRFSLLYNSLLDCNKNKLSQNTQPLPYFYGTKPEVIDMPMEEPGENEGFQ